MDYATESFGRLRRFVASSSIRALVVGTFAGAVCVLVSRPPRQFLSADDQLAIVALARSRRLSLLQNVLTARCRGTYFVSLSVLGLFGNVVRILAGLALVGQIRRTGAASLQPLLRRMAPVADLNPTTRAADPQDSTTRENSENKADKVSAPCSAPFKTSGGETARRCGQSDDRPAGRS